MAITIAGLARDISALFKAMPLLRLFACRLRLFLPPEVRISFDCPYRLRRRCSIRYDASAARFAARRLRRAR